MTALSLTRNVRTPDAPEPRAPPSQGTRLRIGGVSPLSLLTFFAAAKKVSPAPDRGNANRPITNRQGKARPTTSETRATAGKRKPKPETGVAIISALLVVALSAILVSGMLWRQQVQIRRIENQRLLVPGAMGRARRAGLDAPDPALGRRHLRRHHLPRRRMGRPDRQNTSVGFPRPDRRSPRRTRRGDLSVGLDRRRPGEIQSPQSGLEPRAGRHATRTRTRSPPISACWSRSA